MPQRKKPAARVTRRQLEDVVNQAVRRTLSAPAVTGRATDRLADLERLSAGPAVDPARKGLRFAQAVRAYAGARGDADRARDIAYRNDADPAVIRALGSNDADSGGLLLQGELAEEVIELLRPRSAVRQMAPRIVRPERGTLQFPRIDVGASAEYFAENSDIPITEQETGAVVLQARNLGALVAVSNDLLRFTGDGGGTADEVVRDDLVDAIGEREDKAFLRGDGTESEPKGLRHWAADANVFDANSTVNAENIEQDLLTALNNLESADVPMRRPHWLMAPTVRNFLRRQRDSNGFHTFKEEIERGQLLSHPVITTTNIPIDLGAGNDESEVYLVDASQVFLGEVDAVEIEVSRDAAYVESGTTKSAFQRNQTLLRAIIRHDLALRHNVAVSVITAAKWQ